MRLLLDAMLAGLARCLRAAGHDVALAGKSSEDRELIEQARREGRTIVTRDRGLASNAAHNVILITVDHVADQARQLTAWIGVDWLAAPFTRCLIENVPLIKADAAQIATLPPSARDLPGPILACPSCGRVYWPGSHVRRMRARLERWRSGAWDGADSSSPA